MQSCSPLASKEIGVLKMNEQENKAAISFSFFLFFSKGGFNNVAGMFSLIHQKASISNVHFCNWSVKRGGSRE